jgi:hypothetical protein
MSAQPMADCYRSSADKATRCRSISGRLARPLRPRRHNHGPRGFREAQSVAWQLAAKFSSICHHSGHRMRVTVQHPVGRGPVLPGASKGSPRRRVAVLSILPSAGPVRWLRCISTPRFPLLRMEPFPRWSVVQRTWTQGQLDCLGELPTQYILATCLASFSGLRW